MKNTELIARLAEKLTKLCIDLREAELNEDLNEVLRIEDEIRDVELDLAVAEKDTPC